MVGKIAANLFIHAIKYRLYIQVSRIIEKNIIDYKILKKTMEKDVKEILEKIAEKLGTTSEYLFEQLVKQAKLNAITTLIQLILLLIVGALFYRLLDWEVKIGIANYGKVEQYIETYTALAIINIGLLFLYVVSAFSGFFYGIDIIIKCWKNPEGWAINELLDKFK